VHGLIGPNGSGKTTLLNCISGFLRLDRGSISLGDRPLPPAPSERARAGIARTFQQPLLLERESVLENVLVGFAGRPHVDVARYALSMPAARRELSVHRARAVELLAAVGLAELADRPVGELAPGQQRLVEIARALTAEPDVLLLDE